MKVRKALENEGRGKDKKKDTGGGKAAKQATG